MMTQTDLRTEPTDSAEQGGCSCAAPCGTARSVVSRRTAIGVGVIAGAALVSACGSSDTPATSSSTVSTSSSTSSTSSTSATSSSTSSSPSSSASAATTAPSSESSSASSSDTSSAAPAGTQIAKLADVPDGGSLIVANGSDQIALAKNADGTVVAHTAICTHQGCTVKAAGATLSCPCHGSAFDAFTGAATKGPATKPLDAITVTVTSDGVYLSA